MTGYTLYLDTETFCERPLKDGVHRYAEEVEIMIVSWALDDELIGIEGETQIEDLTELHTISCELDSYLADPSIPIVMHNSGFDRTVIRHAWGIDLDAGRIEDTMIRAMSHGLPGGLEKLSHLMKLGVESKAEGGRALIQLFCKPRPKSSKDRRATAFTHPEEWAKFLSYAGHDIPPMRALRRKLPRWNYVRD